MPKQLSSVTFHNGQKMPIVGLGTWQVSHCNICCLYILSIAPYEYLKQRCCGVLGYDYYKVREVINNVWRNLLLPSHP